MSAPATTPKRKPGRPRSGERRKKILICAVRVFARSNYKRARVSDIASEVGVTEAAIYRHFPSKKAIFVAILEHVHERIIANWDAAADESMEPAAAVKAIAKIYYQNAARHMDELKVQFQAASEADDPDIAALLRRHQQAYRKYAETILERGIRSGALRQDIDIGTFAHQFVSAGIYMNMMRTIGDRSFTAAAFEKMIAAYLKEIER